jgi:hypothetical protein
MFKAYPHGLTNTMRLFTRQSEGASVDGSRVARCQPCNHLAEV